MNPVEELQKKIAYKIWQLRGGGSEENWREASKIIHHFLDRRPECADWQSDHEDYKMYEDIIYARELT